MYAHPTATIDDGANLAEGVKVWHHCHVRSGAIIGADTQLGKNVYVDGDVTIGERCKVQNNVSVYTGVTLGDEVFVGPSAVFTNDLFPRAVGEDWEITETTVRGGASIGANATIKCGVTLGEHCMIGAGAVVTHDVENHQLVLGNPARPAGWVCRCGALISRDVSRPQDMTCVDCNAKGD